MFREELTQRRFVQDLGGCGHTGDTDPGANRFTGRPKRLVIG